MKKQLLLCLILMAGCILFAQVPDWQWAVSAGGTQNDECNAIVSDAQGNVYIAGNFWETASFGEWQINSWGNNDIFVAKLDPEGNWLWAIHAGSEGFDEAYGLAVDDAGFIYVTGEFTETAAFGPLSLTSSGYTDVFVGKLAPDGAWQWVVRGGGFTGDEATAIAVNNTGIVITGYSLGDAAFGSHPYTGFGSYDIFIAKLDLEGNWLWARNAGGSLYDYGYAIALDDAGNVYATGSFQDVATFAGTTLTSLGEDDVFIAKLNPDGILIAAFRAGGIGYDFGTGIDLDPAGNVYLSGYFELSIAFGPFVMTSYGWSDAFITKLNSGAIYQWARQGGGIGDDAGSAIAADLYGNNYTVGTFDDEALFGNYTLTGFGNWDAFIAKVDTNGYLNWVVNGGGDYSDKGYCLDFREDGNIYIGGLFEDSAAFGNDILTSQGEYDIFVAKLYSSNIANDDPATPSVTQQSVLNDAYPNPLHPGQAVTIQTDIAKSETGTLTIYNLKGQLIREYNLTSGTHETSLDSRDLASGIYFYRLQTQSTEVSKKLVLIK